MVTTCKTDFRLGILVFFCIFCIFWSLNRCRIVSAVEVRMNVSWIWTRAMCTTVNLAHRYHKLCGRDQGATSKGHNDSSRLTGVVYLCASYSRAHHKNSPTIAFVITTFSGGSGLQNRLQIQNPWTFLRFLHILITQCVQYCECNWLLNECAVNITASLSLHLAQRYTTAVKRELLPARTVHTHTHTT